MYEQALAIIRIICLSLFSLQCILTKAILTSNFQIYYLFFLIFLTAFTVWNNILSMTILGMLAHSFLEKSFKNGYYVILSFSFKKSHFGLIILLFLFSFLSSSILKNFILIVVRCCKMSA